MFCIHVFAAWQAWKYSSSVDCAGASTRVVTPLEDTPGRATGEGCETVGGAAPCGGVGAPAEQPAVTDIAVKTAAVPHIKGPIGRRRTRSIYATLATVMQRTRFWECCRP